MIFSIFSFVRPESEDLRIDIAVLLESLIMGSFQAHCDDIRYMYSGMLLHPLTVTPRLIASLVGDTYYKPSLPTAIGWGSTPNI